MTTRITKSTRERMAKELVRHRFNDRAAELSALSVELFNAALDERYDAATQKLMRQLQKRHPGAFKTTDSLYLSARGMSVTVGASLVGDYYVVRWTPETSSRSILHSEERRTSEPSEPLAERIASFALATKAFAEEIKLAYRRALGALEQFTTAKRLTEEWPEALPVVGHLLAVEDRSLPTVQLEAINDEFGLPPAELEIAA